MYRLGVYVVVEVRPPHGVGKVGRHCDRRGWGNPARPTHGSIILSREIAFKLALLIPRPFSILSVCSVSVN